MDIKKTLDNEKLSVALIGRLDTTTAPSLESELKELVGVKELCFDLENLEYISSAGLRVLLACQKVMSKQGTMELTNVNSTVKEIFDITGFSDILTIR